MVNNCRLELEDRGMLAQLRELPREFRTYSRPKFVSVDWHKTENQGPIGSCRGNALASTLERLQWVRNGSKEKVVQLSRIFAYLATQKLDGLLGRDQGSTITNGKKVALDDGVPPEERTGYPRSYPSGAERTRILSQENYEAGAPFKAVSSWQCPEDPEEAMNFIGGGGAIDIGIVWYSGIIPRDRIIRDYSLTAGGGGHAVSVLGYDEDGNLEPVNSHGDGPFKIAPNAWRKMMRHRYTAAIGLVGTTEPTPVDWLNNSPYYG